MLNVLRFEKVLVAQGGSDVEILQTGPTFVPMHVIQYVSSRGALEYRFRSNV